MNKQSWLVLIVVLALVGGTGAFLEVRKARQKLGRRNAWPLWIWLTPQLIM